MSKIRILPENLANQIAAGEVVERPASVVKELMENSIDSGARHIAVQVEGNGTRLIRVIDDGDGMDQDDLLLCLERHATSKLTAREELDAIKTLGFRGEALPSISSVCCLTITSCPAGSSLGARAEIRYGKVLKVHDMGCAKGTVVEVRDLFGNVPARRKFLKTTKTELLHIEEVVSNYALAYHDLGISYTVDARTIIDLPAHDDSLESRVGRLLVPQHDRKLISVTGRTAGQGIKVSGFIIPPDEAYGANRTLRLFVNGRSVRDRMIHHAVIEGLAGFLMKGRRPAGALFIDLPPSAVDVNVHPTKQEVRFHKAHSIHQLVAASVQDALAAYQKDLKYAVFGDPKPFPAHHEEHTIAKKGNGTLHRDTDVQAGETWDQPLLAFEARISEPEKNWGEGEGRSPSHLQDAIEVPDPPAFASAPPRAAPSCADTGKFAEEACPAGLKPIGQIFNAYILCESEKGLVVIDQHAAQERLLFEALRKQFFQRSVARQMLLFPLVIEATASERETLQKYGDMMGRFGIEIQEFGGESYAVKAIPALMAHVPPEEIVYGVLGQFSGTANETGDFSARRIEHILATMACKAAIKAGDPLRFEEIVHFLQHLHDADVFSHCPHGRPVFRCFSREDIGKWFYRT